MAWLIGIDEAGYGPNLGPLSVGATAWHVEQRGARSERRGTGCERRSNVGGLALAETDMSIDLYQRLADVVSPKPDGQRIAIADSKQLYKPASHSKSNGGLRHLERGNGRLRACAHVSRTGGGANGGRLRRSAAA